ncbi:MAG: uroporphyrinogen decarboxylase family protein [Kiritimatiellae bacterium]|nr:uroporphyrinogen decarboxylase family protein [Kiritimatiellia bacterium]
MTPMTSIERVANAMARRPVDRAPYFDYYWPETVACWVAEGRLKEGENAEVHFGHDIWHTGGLNNTTGDMGFEPVVLEETEETILRMDGNGAKLRFHKQHSSTPEHVGYTVTDGAGWRERIRPHLLDFDRRRIAGIDTYRKQRQSATAEEKAIFYILMAPFECMHAVCGHENLLIGMADDPDWIREMVAAYVNLTIIHMEVVFAEAGKPDGIYLAEDMGFRERPFFSASMYDEMLLAGHQRLIGFFHANRVPVMMHSCGFIEPLVGGVVKAGIDCLQPMEVKAGCDMLRLHARYGDRIAFCGNLDARNLMRNDRAAIEAELLRKIPPVMKTGGYLLHSDHSIPPDVGYDTMRFFFERGCEISGGRLGT